MRYHEITARSFYVSTEEERSGELKGGIVETNLMAPSIEADLEKHRPANCCPRAESLLLHERPVGDRQYCYKVTPLDSLDRTHTGWLKVLAEADPSQVGVIAHYAELFWKGLACKEHPGEPWEVRTSSARVLQRVGGSSRDTLVTPKATI